MRKDTWPVIPDDTLYRMIVPNRLAQAVITEYISDFLLCLCDLSIFL